MRAGSPPDESTRKLARHLERGSGRILAATITRTAGRWYVAFTCELTRQLPTSNGQASTVGVDVGIRHLAVLSTGEQIPNPRPLEHLQRKRRRLQRQWTDKIAIVSPPAECTRVAASSKSVGESLRWKRGQLAFAETSSTS